MSVVRRAAAARPAHHEGDGIDPAARWPDGWRHVMEAESAPVTKAARLAARDERRWVRTKPLKDWMAIRLQLARGRSQNEVSAMFGVSRRSINDHAVKNNWGPMTREQMRTLSTDVAAAGPERARYRKKRIDLAFIAETAEWKPLARLRHCQRHISVEPDEAVFFKPQDEADPDNTSFDWRGRARAELPRVLEEARRLADTTRTELIEATMADLPTEKAARLALKSWTLFRRVSQTPPEGDWRVWLMMGGRGAGKTRAGAEWVRELVEKRGVKRIALVGPTLHDVREVMIEGPSGLKAVASDACMPVYEVSRRRLRWPDGLAEAYVFSAEDPDSLRGPQFEAAWCDEIGAWARDVGTWDTMMFGLRLGKAPRVVATTTPRARELVKRLVKMAERAPGGEQSPLKGGTSGGSGSAEGFSMPEPGKRDPPVVPPFRGDGLPVVRSARNRVVITRAATRENAANLAAGWVEEMEEAYRGSHLLPQELEGVLVEDLAGAIFSRKAIEAHRVAPDDAVGLESIVVAVDPPAGVGEKAAACGIVCAGIRAGVVYVIEDASVRGLRPLEWARRVAEVARRRGAGRIIAESNQGGEMVREMLNMAGAAEISRVKLRNATASKRDRAEPVSGMYDRGVVRHAGVFRELEDELCSFGALESAPSPDRVDALVWAVRELTEKPKARPGILRL